MKHRVHALPICIIAGMILLFAASAAMADPPSTINIRGQLLDAQKHALSGVRDYSVQFFDAASNGTALGILQTGQTNVSAEGLFNIEVTMPSQALLAPELWYEIAVASGTIAAPLTPADRFPNRIKVQSVPFALESANANHVAVSAIGSGAVTDAEFNYLAGLTGLIQDQLNAKADLAGIYTKADVDTALSAKADAASVYTKAEVDASQGAQNTAITTKANAADVVAKAGDTMTGALTVNNSYVGIGQATAPSPATDRLYNVGGSLQWNGNPAYRFPWSPVTTDTQMSGNNGYMANGSTMLALTLPASSSLNVGDTIRVSGLGTGGWKIAQNDSQVICSDSLHFLNASNSWKSRAGAHYWTDVACSADGTKLVACSYSDYIYTSTDSGITWTARDTIRGWWTAASSSDGTKIVACTHYNGKIYTSTDSGVTWVQRTTPVVQYWYDVASSADGTKLVACAYNNNIFTSTDSGATWTPRDSSRSWRSVASSADGTKLVAGVDGGYLYTSTDSGVTWTPRMTDSNRQWYSLASSQDGTKLIAAPINTTAYASSDSGVTWTALGITHELYSVASSADGTRLIGGATAGNIYVSRDSGASWTTYGNTSDWITVASSADGKKLMAGTYTYPCDTLYIYNEYSDSTTTGTGGYLTGGKNTSIELQYFGDNTFVPISYIGSLSAY